VRTSQVQIFFIGSHLSSSHWSFQINRWGQSWCVSVGPASRAAGRFSYAWDGQISWQRILCCWKPRRHCWFQSI